MGQGRGKHKDFLRDSRGDISVPLPLRQLNRFPLLRRIPGYAVGVGARPEHVRMGEGAKDEVRDQ